MKLATPPPFGVLGLVGNTPGETVFPHDLIGATVRGRYRLDAVEHRGSGAVVFRATHLGHGRPVALKIRAPEATPEHSRAFERAATLGAELEHGRLPRLLDRGETEDGLPFVVMEWLEGTTLRAHRGGIEPTRAVKLIAQVLHGLRYLHAREITHANLCPDNLFLAETNASEGQMKILDLGDAMVGGSTGSITLSGLLSGRPGYVAPDQITGADFDHRADLYALGVVFYELLVGASPWPTQDAEELLDYQVGHSIPALPSALAAFDPLVQRLAARDPTDRFASAAAALEALEDCVLGNTRPRADMPTTDDPSSTPPRRTMTLRRGIILGTALGLTAIAATILIDRLTSEADPPPPAVATTHLAAPPVATSKPNLVPAPASPAPSMPVEPTQPAPPARAAVVPPAIDDDGSPDPATTSDTSPPAASNKPRRRRRDATPVAKPSSTPEAAAAEPAPPPTDDDPSADAPVTEPATPSTTAPAAPDPAAPDPAAPLAEPAPAQAGALLEAPAHRGPSADVLLGG